MPRPEVAPPAGPRLVWGPALPCPGPGQRVPVAEEVVVVVGAEAALGALLLPVDAGGVDEGSEHGRGRQPGWWGEREDGVRCCSRGGSVPPAAPASPQPHSETNTHPAAALVRTGLRWRMTSRPGSPPCRGEATGGQSCWRWIWPGLGLVAHLASRWSQRGEPSHRLPPGPHTLLTVTPSCTGGCATGRRPGQRRR